jgi:hypothetical protein
MLLHFTPLALEPRVSTLSLPRFLETACKSLTPLQAKSLILLSACRRRAKLLGSEMAADLWFIKGSPLPFSARVVASIPGCDTLSLP